MHYTGARKLREDEYRESTPARHLKAVQDACPRPAGEGYQPVYGESGRSAHGESGRRTVKITGQPVPPRRRRSPAQSHIQARPDRIALWAFLLGLFLVFMAVATANAAPL